SRRFDHAQQRPPKLFERLRGHCLLVVEAASKSKRSGDDNGASQKDTHGSIPRSSSHFRL
ncbi:MAG: hypothetical protein WA884_19705, partial [Methyloceanibacter sp.]